MSRYFQPLPFSTAYDFEAAKPVTLNGVALLPGDPIDKVGLGDRRLRQLYEARIIRPVAPAELPASQSGLVNAPAQPQEPAQAAQEPQGDETPADGTEAAQEASTPDEAASEGDAPAASGNQIVHRGFGRYFIVDADGNDVSGPWSKAEAPLHLEG